VSVALVTEHALRMRRIVICGLSGYTVFVHIVSQTARFSIKKKVCFDFSLYLLSETFLILRRTERDITINVHRSSCKVPLILVRF
jgi:hypothetical protein